jgi:hypothetical protein
MKGHFPMRRVLLIAAAFGSVAAMPTAQAFAQGSSPYYCIPPTSAQQAAEGDANDTASALTALTRSGLVAAGGVSPMVGASGPGRIDVTITLKQHHHKMLIGQGSETVKAGGCSTLHVRLDGAGKRALKHSKSVTLQVFATFTATRGRHGHGGHGSASATVTLS